jgi:formate dehydrogenase gamma subunit
MPEMPEKERPAIQFIRPVSRRDAVDAYKRLKPVRDGYSWIIRFSLGPRFEHLVLLVAFLVLGSTGLAQTFDNTFPAQQFLIFLGGVEAAQEYHHLFASILGALAIYHAINTLDGVLVRRQQATMLPGRNDLTHFIQMMRLNLGFSRKLPLFERYSFDEKFIYWVTVISVGVLGLTGLLMWFPTLILQVLPGSLYPYAQVFHRWQAIFLVAVVVLLHIYQVVLRSLNASMFSGRMSIRSMKEDHPVELAYMEQAAEHWQEKRWPQAVEFSIPERVAREVVTIIEEIVEEEPEATESEPVEAVEPASVAESAPAVETVPVAEPPLVVESAPEEPALPEPAAEVKDTPVSGEAAQ